VLLESLACGTPVVGANTWGVPEIITSDEIGLLTERREEVIAETILVALKKQWQTENLLEYAKKHTWKHTALGVLQVFQALLDEQNVLSDRVSAGNVIET
jgi:glycosyltransferase involved in cell wall biosynthesis